MALVVKDRVKETSTTSGTGTLTLAGAVAGFRSFADIGNGNTTFYSIVDNNTGQWEVGIGTYTASGTTLSRDTVLSNSSGTTDKINFAANSKDVFVTYPAGKSVNYTDIGGVVITESGTATALRITNTGTGNSLVVEDSANPDSTPFVIDADGNLISGNTSAVSTRISSSNITPSIQQVGAVNNKSNVGVFGFGTNPGYLIAKANGSIGTPTAALENNIVGRISAAGYDGTNYTEAANIRIEVDGATGTNIMPGRLVFSTTADGASTPAERLRIDSNGLLTLASGSGLSIGRTAVTSPAATDGNVFSGTYTPTLTNTTNIASSTAAACQYMRVGSVVTVSGTVTIDPTATGRIVMGFTLPIASNFSAANQCGGTFASSGTTTVNVGSVAADSTNDVATFDGVVADTASRVYAFSFTYRVI